VSTTNSLISAQEAFHLDFYCVLSFGIDARLDVDLFEALAVTYISLIDVARFVTAVWVN
jgi:hypothetical protein